MRDINRAADVGAIQVAVEAGRDGGDVGDGVVGLGESVVAVELPKCAVKAIGAGLVASGTRTKLMEAIRSKEPFVVGYRVSRLNDKVVNISKKDFNDIFPDSDDASVSVSS